MVSVKYECHNDRAEVTFNVDGKEYTRSVCGDVTGTGSVLPDRAYRCRNKRAIIEMVWKLLQGDHEELECNDQVLIKIGEISDISCPSICPKIFHLNLAAP